MLSTSKKLKLTGAAKKEHKKPWVEKYRPKTVDEVAYQEEVVNTLKKAIQNNNLPHLLFYGPPGTGKTSTILAVARALYGPELVKKRVMELNASDERGIGIIREKVKTFAQVAAGNTSNDGSNEGNKYPCPPFKIIILDEADSMTQEAQAALRRIMETYSSVTRFCLICNYISRIIDPITSRCAKFRFKLLEGDTMVARLQHICKEEGVKITEDALRTLVSVSEGDMRKAITTLQSTHTLLGSRQMTAADVLSTAGVIPEETMEKLLNNCKTKSFFRLQAGVQDVMMEGYSGHQILLQLFQHILNNEQGLSSAQKSEIAIQLAQADHRLVDGADEFLQLLDVCTSLMRVFTSSS
ncbi:replication factor C subunit 4 [Balamuthia mandrillaris]